MATTLSIVIAVVGVFSVVKLVLTACYFILVATGKESFRGAQERDQSYLLLRDVNLLGPVPATRITLLRELFEV